MANLNEINDFVGFGVSRIRDQEDLLVFGDVMWQNKNKRTIPI